MASLAPEEKLKFLLQIMETLDGKPNFEQVATKRGDKKDNIRYQFKAIVASSGEFVLENGKVTATDNDGQPVKKVSTPKTPRTKKAKKVEAEVKDDVEAGSEEESVSVVPPSPASGTKRGRAKKDGNTPAKKRQTKKQKQEVETIAEEGEDAAMDETTTVKSEEGEQEEF